MASSTLRVSASGGRPRAKGRCAFVVIEVLHAPVAPDSSGEALFFTRSRLVRKYLTLVLRFRRAFDLPIAPDDHGAAGVWQPGGQRSDGGDGCSAGVDGPVPGFAAYGKNGVYRRAATAVSWGLGVLSLVPKR